MVFKSFHNVFPVTKWFFLLKRQKQRNIYKKLLKILQNMLSK